MKNISVRTKILSIIALFTLVIIGTNLNSAISSRQVSSDLQTLSKQSLDLLSNLEKSRQLLLQQSVEFERGYFQVLIAKSMGNYGKDRVQESEAKFKGYTDQLIKSIQKVKATLASMPKNQLKTDLVAQIDDLEQLQSHFLSSSLETYSWWVKLNTMKGNKPRKAAAATLHKINTTMDVILPTIDQYDASLATNKKKQLNQNIYTSSSIAVALIIVGIIISWFIINGICTPLKLAVKRAEEIASGELINTSNKQSKPRKDEIGALESAMNKLVEQLSGILHEVSESSNKLTSAAHHLNSITDDSSKMVDQQHRETSQISNAVQEIQSTATHVSESTFDAREAAQAAEEAATSGTKIVNGTIDSITQLAQELESSVNSINELHENTHEISNILNVILDIAEQTNLLALNAAIEAARAGEQGRGFAVVADEVRQLSHNTHGATQQIEQMINRLQSGASSAVEAMNISHGRSLQVVEQVRNEETSLANIHQSVSKIRDMNDRISTTAEEQAQVTKEVSQNVMNITDIATKTTDSIHSISESAEQLADLASQLSTKIRYFNV
ncbi:Methyl-accepting chemotaxis protein CtpH [Marinomonas spartinae]|uniref:Methyl-accepting chemotaxis protein CtpH n=1 Tax=Marinomonas spartinae TaxID=1792290 RepID=A0A1A8TJM6_9GAMM|nr:methyl-accepting chemotaxis protein [Marinomonas spartinae]SBS33668.1 Methyl-accepting chemotaxis protein CtpH [Marinomonas spartinae]